MCRSQALSIKPLLVSAIFQVDPDVGFLSAVAHKLAWIWSETVRCSTWNRMPGSCCGATAHGPDVRAVGGVGGSTRGRDARIVAGGRKPSLGSLDVRWK